MDKLGRFFAYWVTFFFAVGIVAFITQAYAAAVTACFFGGVLLLIHHFVKDGNGGLHRTPTEIEK